MNIKYIKQNTFTVHLTLLYTVQDSNKEHFKLKRNIVLA